MRRIGVLVMVALAATMTIGVGSASALSGGGKKPSEAPLVAWGQHYEASLGNAKSEANYLSSGCCGTSYQVAIYHLGPLAVHDQVAVNWHALPFAHSSGFPVHFELLENVDDFTWAPAFIDYDTPEHSLSGSGSARTEITVQNSSASDYLVFYSEADETDSQDLETYLYDFTVEAPRHYLGLSLGSVQKVAANGVLHATATLATGAFAPDGLVFTLNGTWSGGVFTTTAASVGGQITFPLALPETAWKHSVEFVATTAATAEWQAATSPKMTVEVTKPPVTVPAPVVEPQLCTKATTRAHVLARQYHRQLKHASRARGRNRRRLSREARATGRKLDAAKAARKAAC